jgi:peptidyl-prolyl cis-trans isomerase C
MITRPLIPVLLLAAFVALGACGQKSPDDSKVLATVNGEVITEKDFDSFLRAQNIQIPQTADEAKIRKDLLEEMIKMALLSQYAVDQKVDQEHDVYFQIRRHRENILARAMLRKHLKESPISDDEVQKKFDELSAKADRNEYRARHILVRSEEEARAILDQLKKGGNFAALAKDKSIDVRSGKQGGDLGSWINQDMIVPEFMTALVALKNGETTKDPVKSNFGWHIIKREASRPRKMPTFDQAKGDVRQLIQQERVEALVKTLREKGSVKIKD